MILQGSMNTFWVRYPNFKDFAKTCQKGGSREIICPQEIGEVPLHHSAPASVNQKKKKKKNREGSEITLKDLFFVCLELWKGYHRFPLRQQSFFGGGGGVGGRDRPL